MNLQKMKRYLFLTLSFLGAIIFFEKLKSIFDKQKFMETDPSKIVFVILLLIMLGAIEFYIYLDLYFKNKNK